MTKVMTDLIPVLQNKIELLGENLRTSVHECYVLRTVVDELRQETELMKKQQRVVRQHEEGLHAVIQVVKDIVNQQDENQKSLSETLHKMETHYCSTSGRVDASAQPDVSAAAATAEQSWAPKKPYAASAQPGASEAQPEDMWGQWEESDQWWGQTSWSEENDEESSEYSEYYY